MLASALPVARLISKTSGSSRPKGSIQLEVHRERNYHRSYKESLWVNPQVEVAIGLPDAVNAGTVESELPGKRKCGPVLDIGGRETRFGKAYGVGGDSSRAR